MSRSARIFFLILLIGGAVFTASCGSDHSQVRFLLASQTAGAQDIAVDGKTQVTNLTFGSLSPATGYVTVAAGNRRVEARPTGTTDDLINSIVGFASSKQYTLLVIGEDPSFAFLQKTDDNSAPASGSAKLRIIHASPDAHALPSPASPPDSQSDAPANLDVYLVAPGTDITSLTPAISALVYQQASSYQILTAGTYEVIMTDHSDATKFRLVDQTYALAAGQVRTLVTVDASGELQISGTPLVLADVD